MVHLTNRPMQNLRWNSCPFILPHLVPGSCLPCLSKLSSFLHDHGQRKVYPSCYGAHRLPHAWCEKQYIQEDGGGLQPLKDLCRICLQQLWRCNTFTAETMREGTTTKDDASRRFQHLEILKANRKANALLSMLPKSFTPRASLPSPANLPCATSWKKQEPGMLQLLPTSWRRSTRKHG